MSDDLAHGLASQRFFVLEFWCPLILLLSSKSVEQAFLGALGLDRISFQLYNCQ